MGSTSSIGGYVYGIPEQNRLNEINLLGDLYTYSKNWNTAYSVDNTQNADLWANALNDTQKIYTKIISLLEGVVTGESPATSELMMLLAPPGNTFVFNEGSPAEQHINTPGSLWNIWAVYEQYLNPGLDVNNIWNNSWANGVIPSNPPVATTPTTTPSIVHFSTVPLSGATQNPDYRFLDPNANGTSFTSKTTTSALVGDEDYRKYLVQALYDFKSLTPSWIKSSIDSLTTSFSVSNTNGTTTSYGAAQILKRPALQDSLFFSYSLSGDSQLQSQLGSAIDDLRNSEYILNALNLINNLLALEPEVDRNLKPVHNDASGIYNTSIWEMRNYILSGYSMLNLIYKRGVVTDSIGKSLILSILAFTSQAASYIRVYNQEGTSANRLLAFDAISNIWLGLGFGTSPSDINGNKAVNAINNAISNYEFINQNLKQSLQKSMFIYQEFISSSTLALQKIQSMFRSVAQKTRQ